MSLLTSSMLGTICPKANVMLWLTKLQQAMDEFHIDTPLRIAAFMAQAAHESAEFTRTQENLDYSTAKRIVAVWPKRFTLESAKGYIHAPQKLANRAYAGRNGNGPEESGDGWNYRGSGIFQLTGKNNFSHIGSMLQIDIVGNPDWCEWIRLLLPVRHVHSGPISDSTRKLMLVISNESRSRSTDRQWKA